MKRYGYIYEKICTIENLREAHKNARKGKLHYKEVKMVDRNPDYYLLKIQKQLIDKTYHTSDYILKTINESGKVREISKLPYFPDRIIHWAIMQQIEPILLKTFVSTSYSSIPNRGLHKGLIKLNTALKKFPEETAYCLKLDVRKFYPSINLQCLKTLLRRKFKDPNLLWLLDEIIDSVKSDKGVPIGNYCSQYFANFYLTYFDHWLKEVKHIKFMYRYCDDVVILHKDKAFLHSLQLEIISSLKDKLKLDVKDNWQVFPTDERGIDFLGYRSYLGPVLLRKSTLKRMKLKCKKISKHSIVSEKDNNSLQSYKGWLQWGNCFNIYLKYIVPLERRYPNYKPKEFRTLLEPHLKHSNRI